MKIIIKKVLIFNNLLINFSKNVTDEPRVVEVVEGAAGVTETKVIEKEVSIYACNLSST